MSSDYDTYGNLKVKSVLLDAPSGLVFHDPNDDTKKATLKVTGLSAGNIDLQLPTSNGTLMTTADSVSLQPGDIDNANLFAANVVDANALASNAVVDANIAAGANIASPSLLPLTLLTPMSQLVRRSQSPSLQPLTLLTQMLLLGPPLLVPRSPLTSVPRRWRQPVMLRSVLEPPILSQPLSEVYG